MIKVSYIVRRMKRSPMSLRDIAAKDTEKTIETTKEGIGTETIGEITETGIIIAEIGGGITGADTIGPERATMMVSRIVKYGNTHILTFDIFRSRQR